MSHDYRYLPHGRIFNNTINVSNNIQSDILQLEGALEINTVKSGGSDYAIWQFCILYQYSSNRSLMKTAKATESCRLAIIYVKEYFTIVNCLGRFMLVNIRFLQEYEIH